MEEHYCQIVVRNLERILRSEVYSSSEKHRALFTLFSQVAEDITENDKISFTTLFSRLAYIGGKHSIPSRELYFLHLFRRAFEKQINSEFNLEELGTYVINCLLYYAADGDTPELSKSLLDVYTRDVSKVEKYYPVLRGVISSFDGYTADFINEADGHKVLKVQFDVADKNEIFTANIDSFVKHIPMPINVALVDVEMLSSGIYVPQGVVLNPDFLLDVTAIADCFKEYGTESMLSIIKPFRTVDKTSMPLLIGNISNIFLDELTANEDVSFKDLLPKVFSYNPLIMATFEDEEIKEMVSKAKIHFDNIKHSLKVEAAKLKIKKDNIYLEPSFFSATYGLQGRLDMFHHDTDQNKYDIVELKSGSPYKPNIYGLSNTHFVQTLLYDLLIKSTFGNHVKPSNYILYSKLSGNSIKYAPAARAQQYEALKVRNNLMILNYLIAFDIEKFKSLLGFIHEDKFPKVKGFLLSDIVAFRKVYERAGELFRDYLVEFTSFIKREQFLSKTGIHGIENSNGLAAIWLEPYEEKEDRFALLKKMQIISNESSELVPTLTLKYTRDTNQLANFRVGDIVVLYPYNERPDAALDNQIFKCTVLERDAESIKVKLRSSQYNNTIFRKYNYWNIEEDKLDSSYHKAYSSIYQYVSCDTKRRDLIAGLETPKPFEVNDLSLEAEGMTHDQVSLVSKMVSAPEYFLVWGPPGSGKTSVIIKNAVKYLMDQTAQNILLLAYTNRAVDELCDAVASIGPDYGERFIRIGSVTACKQSHKHRVLENLTRKVKSREEVRQIIKPTRIFIGTVSSLINKPELFKIKSFETTIVDEASQILEPHLVGLLSTVSKFVLIGDHKQLPAVVQQPPKSCSVVSDELKCIGITSLGMSLFERMYKQATHNNWSHVYGMLHQQGRMNVDIMKFPNAVTYEGKLSALPSVERLTQKSWPMASVFNIPNERLVFVDASINQGLYYKTNRSEAEIVCNILKDIKKGYADINREISHNDIGVITPYRAQISLIKNICQESGVDIEAVTVDTVERFQGGARDVIIISFCVNRERQFRSLVSLSDEGVDRKLNVALTRAKEMIIIVGNREVLSTNATYKRLIDSCYHWNQSSVDA